jgi:hypothetical protein
MGRHELRHRLALRPAGRPMNAIRYVAFLAFLITAVMIGLTR